MDRRAELSENLTAVRARIDAACAEAGRPDAEPTLVVVTKFFPASDVEILADLGVRHIGENKEQEAGPKVAELTPEVRAALEVHFVGQLQSNKAGRVAGFADVVQSVDRAKIVRALDRGRGTALEDGRAQTPLRVLLQVDLGRGEAAGRGGAAPADLAGLVEAVGEAEHLQLRGVMAVAPLGLDADGTRAAFEELMTCSARVREQVPEATAVSAGMSGDLEIAIAAGATHLRVGSAILGSRPAPR